MRRRDKGAKGCLMRGTCLRWKSWPLLMGVLYHSLTGSMTQGNIQGIQHAPQSRCTKQPSNIVCLDSDLQAE